MTRQASTGVGLALLGLLLTIALSDALAQAPPPGLSLHDAPRPLPEIRFESGEGKAMSLADFRGSVVLLNLWATWCAPCRREMPTLDRLQAALGGPAFQVTLRVPPPLVIMAALSTRSSPSRKVLGSEVENIRLPNDT